MMSRWKNGWLSQAARIDAISLRERILLLATVMACLAALANWAWLAPAQDAHRQLARHLDQQAIELKKAQADLAAVARPVATDASGQRELDEVQRRLASERQALSAMSSTASLQATPLTGLLVHLLQQQDGLTLVRTATMSPTSSTSSAAPVAAARASGATDAAVPDGLLRQGVELTVTGPYAQLVRYVQALEQALPQVRWGTMSLRSETRPPELTLQLYVVEARKP